MPDVSAASQCALSITAEINRMRRNQVTLHGEPACTEDYGGEWAAVFATGTEQEASDVWVVVAAAGRVERHRVRRTPYGVRFTSISMYRGLAVLAGRSIQSEEMPANAEALVAFAIPFPGNPAPATLELQPALTPLLGATDRLDLDNRLQGLLSEAEADTDTVRPILARSAEGPRGLIGALPSTQSVPVVRAWQLGVYERLGDMHAQLDPTNARVSAGHEIVRRVAERGGCDDGWRCLLPPEGRRELPECAVAPQVQFKRVGATTVVATVIDAGSRPEALGQPSPDRMSAARTNDPQDRVVAQRLSLDPIEGPVVGASRGPVKFIAFTTVEGERRVTHVYVVSPNRAPRRFEDPSLSSVTAGPRVLQLRDVDGNEEPELLVAARSGTSGIVNASTLFWPPTVTDRATFPRLDVTRALIESHNMEEADRALRAFQPSPFENDEQLCQLVARISQTTPRQLASLVGPSGFTIIDYNTQGHPLRGTIRRMAVADVRNAANIGALFGPFSETPCNELECDSAVGFCKLRRGGREVGYLWLGPRRNHPYWGVSRFSGR